VLPGEGIRVCRRQPSGPTEVSATVKVRRGQDYFRDAVLNNFGGRCGITQLPVRELLVASHILPWSDHPEERLNVGNGICLSCLHDATLDCHLISFDEKLRLVLSPRLKQALPHRAMAESFGAYAGEPLNLPADAVAPDPAFLAKHRAEIAR
jgi:predicted restriction endonuclease